MAQDDEYPAGVSDGRLAACQQDVLKMVELAAQVAEGLAANVDPEAEGAPEANTIKEDAAMFLRLADGVQETMAQSRWPVEHAYARSAENLLLRRRLDEMVEEAQDELGHALRTHLAAALRDQAANAARPPRRAPRTRRRSRPRNGFGSSARRRPNRGRAVRRRRPPRRRRPRPRRLRRRPRPRRSRRRPRRRPRRHPRRRRRWTSSRRRQLQRRDGRGRRSTR